MATRQEWMALQQDWDQSGLGTYLLYDFWSPDDGLCVLAGFDFSAHRLGTPYQLDWTVTLSPVTFQGHSCQADEVEATTLLDRMQDDLNHLHMIWANSRRDEEAEVYPPAFFIEWALSKNFAPDWLDWAIGTRRYFPKQEPEKRPSPGLDKVSLPNPPQIAMDIHAGAVVVQPANEHRPAATGPLFTMKKAAMIDQHKHEWPTIEQDIKDAGRNGLNKAKADQREWKEAEAMEWARAKGKLISIDKPTDGLAGAMGKMASLPVSRKHTCEG